MPAVILLWVWVTTTILFFMCKFNTFKTGRSLNSPMRTAPYRWNMGDGYWIAKEKRDGDKDVFYRDPFTLHSRFAHSTVCLIPTWEFRRTGSHTPLLSNHAQVKISFDLFMSGPSVTGAGAERDRMPVWVLSLKKKTSNNIGPYRERTLTGDMVWIYSL